MKRTSASSIESRDGSAAACSFCEAPDHDVETLIAGPQDLFICSDCISGLAETLEGGPTTFQILGGALCSFCSTRRSTRGTIR
jgi:hypothetical protein